MAEHRVKSAPEDTLPTMPRLPSTIFEEPPEQVVAEGPLPHWLDSEKGRERQAALEHRVGRR